MPWTIKVSAANISDNQASILYVDLLVECTQRVLRLEKITADRGYKNTFVDYLKTEYGVEVEIAQKPESKQGFIPQKKSLAGGKKLGMAKFSANIVSRCRENYTFI